MGDAQASRVGSMFGPYHLKRLLGRGGMGEVYEAEHTVKEWTVAVKLMSEEFSKDPVFRERMKREARIAGRLQEPHVVPIHDYGEIDGQMFLEMRLIEGADLDGVLKRFGPLTPPRAVAIITQIASALDAAHAAGVMHRDIKPQNILVTRDDFAYLVDFGIASATTDEKLTQLGTAVGTWKYMAPERFSNDEVTYRADIYALACVLHECLTGSPPYESSSAGALVNAHTSAPIPQPSALRPGIPKAFDAVVARGMAKKPEDRYASAGDLALAAHEALSDPDQDHANDILRRSQEATLPGTAMAAPPPPGPTVNTPPPSPLANTPPPGPPASGPSSGPIPSPTGRPWTPDSGPTPTPAYYQPSSSNWGGPPQQFGAPAPWKSAPTETQTQPLAHHRRRRSCGAGPRRRSNRYLDSHEWRRHRQSTGASNHDEHHHLDDDQDDDHHDHPGRQPPKQAAQRAACGLSERRLHGDHAEAEQHLGERAGHGRLRPKHPAGRPISRGLRAVRKSRCPEKGV